jgi:outer membrane biosynthesis protein TonB
LNTLIFCLVAALATLAPTASAQPVTVAPATPPSSVAQPQQPVTPPQSVTAPQPSPASSPAAQAPAAPNSAPAAQAAPPAQPAPAAAVKVTTTVKDPPADKPCLAATRKLTREQSSLDAAQAEVQRYRKLQQGCASKTVCARYASALTSLDKRIARQQRRIERFDSARTDACKRA